MDSDGRFQMMEKDDQLSLVYIHPKYHPIPQIQSPSSSDEAARLGNPFQPLFLCPVAHRREDRPNLLPLFWCNNKEFDANGGCNICEGSKFGTDYYLCDYCNAKYHRECVESPLRIKHPYHPQHSLQLSFRFHIDRNIDCLCCGRIAVRLVYDCTICEVFMHPICAMQRIPFVIDPPKRHNHSLTFFPRQTSLTCNVCGLLRKIYPTYICAKCNFVAHKDCMYSPRIIKISRHHHRISYISSIGYGEWICGVCRQYIDGDYGAYTCDKCSDYVVHPTCALRKNVWDGEDLEGVLEEDDITQDIEPFDMISEGLILHFLHDHHLQLKVNILYDEKKLCEACVLPIFEGNFYSCMECEFILHETCAKAPRRIQQGLHPHPLTLKDFCGYNSDRIRCDACERFCDGFIYGCHIGECNFDLDVRCASVHEPYEFIGHEHPLFLALDPKEKPICHVCKRGCPKQLNCIKCDFIACIKCATLPYKAKYKHDEHFLTLLWGEDVPEKDWCEVCEYNLKYTYTEVFYRCNECCSSFHIDCLLGIVPYMKPGNSFKLYGMKVQVLLKN